MIKSLISINTSWYNKVLWSGAYVLWGKWMQMNINYKQIENVLNNTKPSESVKLEGCPSVIERMKTGKKNRMPGISQRDMNHIS